MSDNNATMTEIHGLGELQRRVLDNGLCAACGACVGGCPYMTAFKGRTIPLHTCTVEHGRCYTYCPMTFFDEDAVSRLVFGMPREPRQIGTYRTVYGARSADKELAEKAQGGGTVTALIAEALLDGIIDAAVLTHQPSGSDFAEGTVVTDPDEAARCAGSRYVGAHSLKALREALDAGYDKIGVVGVPCQVRSVRKMMLYDIKGERIRERIKLVLGLFCNWAFSSRDFAAFLGSRLDVHNIRSIEIPPPPADRLEVETTDGLYLIPLDEVRPLIQAACNICGDMTSEYADISVGMYEGKPGRNTLITRTAVGAELTEAMISSGRLECEPFPEENLTHLKAASAGKHRRETERP